MWCRLAWLHRRLASTSVRNTTSSNSSTSSTCSILEHSEYLAMHTSLQARRGGLGPLDTVSLHLLASELAVSTAVLRLNALGLQAPLNTHPSHTRVHGLKEEGGLVTGGLSHRHDVVLLARFLGLVAEAGVEEGQLRDELFVRGMRRKKRRWHQLQRQLVGFYLVGGLEDGARRLPVEAYTRLGKLASPGPFTQQEEALILAWVEERGEKEWTELAESLGRRYHLAGVSVKAHFDIMAERRRGRRKGRFTMEEVEVVMREVFRHNPKVLVLEHLHSHGVDFSAIAGLVGRDRPSVYNLYVDSVHPVLRRHEAGTLATDVRPLLIQHLKAQGCRHSAEADLEEAAARAEFRGHTRASLHRLWDGLLNPTVKRLGLSSKRLVTVEQVEEWWSSTGRRPASEARRRRREEEIVGIYLDIKAEMETIKDVS